MMARIAQLSIMLVCVAVAGCKTTQFQQKQAEAEHHWNEVRGDIKLQLAKQAFGSNAFAEAVCAATESISLDPKNADAYVLLARANLEMGRDASAEHALAAGLQAGLTSPELHYMSGVVFERRGRLDSALAAFTKARQLRPSDADYLLAEAECLVELDRSGQALSLIEEHRGRIDRGATAAYLAGRIAAMLGDRVEAVAHYREALAGLGSNRTVAEELGLTLAGLGRYEEAITLLGPVVEDPHGRPDAGALRRALANCHLAMNDASAAQRVLADYARSHPSDVPAQLLLIKASLAAGDEITALRAADRADQYKPHDVNVRLMRATVHWWRNNQAEAAELLFDLLTENPRDVEAHCLLAEVMAKRNRFEAAKAHFEEALELEPDCIWAIQGLRSLAETADPSTPDELPAKFTAATWFDSSSLPAKARTPR